MDAVCFDCRFFSPEGIQRVDDLTEQDWDECLDGECRKSPPSVGRFRGEEQYYQYDFGQWPHVQAAEWCGEFEPCRRAMGRDAEPARPFRGLRLIDHDSADNTDVQPVSAVSQSQEA